MKGDGWSQAPDALEFFREAVALVKLPDDAAGRDREAIVSTLKLEQAGWQQHDLATNLARYSDDAVAVSARGEQPSPYDVKLDRQQMESRRRVQFRGTTNPDMKWAFENVRVTIRGDDAEMRLLVTLQSPGYFKTFEAIDRFRRTPQGWKVTAMRSWPVAERNGTELTRFDAAYWKAKDEAVEKARAANNKRELASALIAAERIAEADALLKTLVAEAGADANIWRMRGVAASDLGNGDEARKAFRRAAALDPELVLPWFESRELAAIKVAAADVHGVDIHPDGKTVVAAAGKMIYLWDIESKREIRSFDGHQRNIGGLAFSPDGLKIASGGADCAIKIWDTNTGRELLALRGHQNTVQRLAWTRDGKRLASASSDATVRLWNVETGQLIHTMVGHTNIVYGLAFTPDEVHLISASADQTLIRFDVESGKATGRLDGANGALSSVAVSPDGQRVAVAGTLKRINIFESRQLQRSLLGHTGNVDTVKYSPDGKSLASTSYDSTIRIWNSADGKLLQVLRGHRGPVYSAAFSRDGKQLVSAGADGTIRVWDLADDRE